MHTVQVSKYGSQKFPEKEYPTYQGQPVGTSHNPQHGWVCLGRKLLAETGYKIFAKIEG